MLPYLSRTATALLAITLALSACSEPPEQKAARYMKRGDTYFEQGVYDKARTQYLNALRAKPTDANTIYHLGLVNDAQGNFRDAFSNFAAAEQQDKHFHPALLKLAEYFLAGGQYGPASQRIDLVLSEAPDNAQARALLAVRYLKQKQYEEGKNEAQKSLAVDPNNVLAIGVMAGYYETQNDIAKATQIIEDGVTRNPTNETLLRLKAQIYMQQKNVQKTTEAYESLFKVSPKDRKYRAQLAEFYLNVGQKDQAEAALRQGIAALPDDWEMKHALVSFLDNNRGLETADKEIRAYLTAAPESQEPVNWLVELYLSHQATDRADSFLNDIIAQGSKDKQWLYAMTAKARIDYMKKDSGAASLRIADILKIDPNNLDAQFLKAHIEADHGAFAQAVIDLRSVIRDNPRAKEAYDILSEILLQQGHTDLAIDTLNQRAEIEPLSTPQKVRLAQLYALNGDPKHALDLLMITTKSEPEFPVGWEMTARIALSLKDWTTADAAIETLDGLKGQHQTAQLLRGQKLAQNSNLPEAIAVFQSIIAADPTQPQAEHAIRAMVQAYQVLHQLPEAARYLESLPVQTPLSESLLGQCYVATGNLEKAAALFDKAIAEGSKQQDPFIERARIYITNGNNDAALDLLSKAPNKDGTDTRAPLASAQLLERMGRYKEAIALYFSLLEQHPDSDLTANNLAEAIADHAYEDKDLMEKARQVAERFTASQNPLLLDTLAWTYYRQDRNEDALSIIERAAPLLPAPPPQFRYHYGAILLKAGLTVKALNELRQATATQDKYPGIDHAQKLLAEAEAKK